jgi:hypothetical protein
VLICREKVRPRFLWISAWVEKPPGENISAPGANVTRPLKCARPCKIAASVGLIKKAALPRGNRAACAVLARGLPGAEV